MMQKTMFKPVENYIYMLLYMCIINALKEYVLIFLKQINDFEN